VGARLRFGGAAPLDLVVDLRCCLQPAAAGERDGVGGGAAGEEARAMTMAMRRGGDVTLSPSFVGYSAPSSFPFDFPFFFLPSPA